MISRVPGAELSKRIKQFQQLLKRHKIDLALIRQNADMYYFAGAVQDAHLLIPDTGEPVMLVWRVYDRAKADSTLKHIYRLPSLRYLPELIKKHAFDKAATVGLELDCMPANMASWYSKKLWAQSNIVDISPLVRQVRAIKSDWEISQIKAASRQIQSTIAKVPNILKPGMSELEIISFIGKELQTQGHPGLIRMRTWNQELVFGQVLSGSAGVMPSWTLTPAGGLGVGPAYGLSASWRHVSINEPVCIDIGGWINGYLSDQTRMFVLGKANKEYKSYYNWILDLHHRLRDMLVPGIEARTIYEHAVRHAEQAGLKENFMGFQHDRVKFVGHGLGIEIDEYPFLAKGNKMPLLPGMVIAIEPKLAIPGLGMIGIEDTYLLTDSGAEQLTTSPQDIVTV